MPRFLGEKEVQREEEGKGKGNEGRRLWGDMCGTLTCRNLFQPVAASIAVYRGFCFQRRCILVCLLEQDRHCNKYPSINHPESCPLPTVDVINLSVRLDYLDPDYPVLRLSSLAK